MYDRLELSIERIKMLNTAHKQEVENGDVSFALVDSRSNPAWHSFANKVFSTEDGDVSVSQIMEGAKLSNWNVRLEDVAPLAPQHNFIADSFLVLEYQVRTRGRSTTRDCSLTSSECLYSRMEMLQDVSSPAVLLESCQLLLSIKKIREAKLEEIDSIKDIGPVVSKSIYEWLQDKGNATFLEELQKSVKIQNPKSKIQNLKLDGKLS